MLRAVKDSLNIIMVIRMMIIVMMMILMMEKLSERDKSSGQC